MCCTASGAPSFLLQAEPGKNELVKEEGRLKHLNKRHAQLTDRLKALERMAGLYLLTRLSVQL